MRCQLPICGAGNLGTGSNFTDKSARTQPLARTLRVLCPTSCGMTEPLPSLTLALEIVFREITLLPGSGFSWPMQDKNSQATSNRELGISCPSPEVVNDPDQSVNRIVDSEYVEHEPHRSHQFPPFLFFLPLQAELFLLSAVTVGADVRSVFFSRYPTYNLSAAIRNRVLALSAVRKFFVARPHIYFAPARLEVLEDLYCSRPV